MRPTRSVRLLMDSLSTVTSDCRRSSARRFASICCGSSPMYFFLKSLINCSCASRPALDFASSCSRNSDAPSTNCSRTRRFSSINRDASLAVTFIATMGSSCANEIENASTVLPRAPLEPTVSTLMLSRIFSMTSSKPALRTSSG